jgi:hypothetical protein
MSMRRTTQIVMEGTQAPDKCQFSGLATSQRAVEDYRLLRQARKPAPAQRKDPEP